MIEKVITKNKSFLFFLFFITLVGSTLVFASEDAILTVKINIDENLEIKLMNDTSGVIGANCEVRIIDPNNNIDLGFSTMTDTGTSWYNYTYSFDELGYWKIDYSCSYGVESIEWGERVLVVDELKSDKIDSLNVSGINYSRIDETIYEINESIINHGDLNWVTGNISGNITLDITSEDIWNYTFSDNRSAQQHIESIDNVTSQIGITETDIMDLTMIIALGIVAFIFLYISFNLEQTHFFLKMMLVFFSIITILIMPATIISGSTASQDSFLNILLWFFRIFVTYIIGYIFYHWAKTNHKMIKFMESAKSKW